uniref:Uncharacterized protein n=1 Tax=Anguilla anguilla TaxID=7936 RepID=A0A0E9PKX2_ANGAN
MDLFKNMQAFFVFSLRVGLLNIQMEMLILFYTAIYCIDRVYTAHICLDR